MLGDNRDVRLPNEMEQKRSCRITFGSPPTNDPFRGLKVTAIELDGLFFADGEFVGPNKRQLWEHVVCEAEVCQQVAKAAQEEFQRNRDASQALAAIERVTGPGKHFPPPPPDARWEPEQFRQRARGELALGIAACRQMQGDEQTLSRILSWADAAVPQYRRHNFR